MGTVGVIGTGTMGAAMARRLLTAGHDVRVFDSQPASTEPLVELGALAAASVVELIEGCSVVITSLPGPAEVETVSGAIAASAPAELLHVGHSTVSIECARRVAAEAAGAGLQYLDAPVSGGRTGIEAGTLTVFASGPESARTAAQPYMDAYAGRVFDLGEEPGLATLAKLVNNAIFLCSGLVHQEAIVLATKAGMDPALIDDVLAAGSASLYLALAGPTLSKAWDDSWFALALAEKDVALALEAARTLAVPMPVTTAAHLHYLAAMSQGLGDKLCLATLAAVERMAGVEVPPRTHKTKGES